MTRLLGFILLAACGEAEIVDRIAVSVGRQVITEDQIREEILVTDFLNREKTPVTPEAKKKAAERLIEQTLVKREMEISRYPVPELSEADQSLSAIRTQYGGGQALEDALRAAGITVDELKRHLWWQITVLRFIDYRFRPGVQVSDAEIQTYYNQDAEKLRARGVTPIPSLDDSRERIEQLLTQQRADEALDRWMGDTRTQVEIRYHAEAFE
jgi:peptidyl-prolyl cis-trans isomerase SurA